MGDTGRFSLPMSGQRRRGRIRYQVRQAPHVTAIRHCTDCRQLASGAFSMGMVVPGSGFAVG